MELSNVAEASQWQLIFESNRLEGAGLPESETRRIIQATAKAEVAPTPTKEGVSNYEGHARRVEEVRNHYSAWLLASLYAGSYSSWIDSVRSRGAKPWERVFVEVPEKNGRPLLLAESRVLELHRILSAGLIEPECSGAYAQEPRIVGDLIPPGPDLIPACMASFVTRANEMLSNSWAKRTDPFTVAAWVSYEFVRIHPFVDFNGRLSRILMNMVLRAYEFPFCLVIKGDAKSKKRYREALRRADRGDIGPLVVLLSITAEYVFEALDRNLELGGEKPLLHFAPTEFDPQFPWHLPAEAAPGT